MKLFYGAMFAAVLLVGCGGGGSDKDSPILLGMTTEAHASLPSAAIANPAYGTLVQQLYISYFGRPADVEGLASFQAQLIGLGVTPDIQTITEEYTRNPAFRSLIDSFAASEESKALYPDGTAAFVTAVFKNVLNRTPDLAGLEFWTNAIDHGGLSRANAAQSIMAGALSNTSAQGLLDATVINKRVAFSSAFSAALNSPVLVKSYSGQAVAADVRATLSAITADSDPKNFGALIDATILRLARATADRDDEVSGAQVHVIYAVPAGGADQRRDLGSALYNSVGSYNNWLAAQTGGRKLRFDLYKGNLDVTFVRLPRTDDQYVAFGDFRRDTIEADLKAGGMLKTGKIYTVYYEGTNTRTCADAPLPPVLPGQVSVMYLNGLEGRPGILPCNQNQFAASASAPPGYLDFAMLHEVVHTLGGVASSAPNHVLSGHVSTSPTDLMYAGSLPWQPSVLDANKSNYYNPAGLPSGVFNLATSEYLLPAQ